MSYNKKSYKKYSRQKVREENLFIADELHRDEYSWEEDYWLGWADLEQWGGDGKCYSMNEYHQMHLLHLLRHFNLANVKELLSERGWWP
jgi:hypothetical protein